jgi:hypothetical protein
MGNIRRKVISDNNFVLKMSWYGPGECLKCANPPEFACFMGGTLQSM